MFSPYLFSGRSCCVVSPKISNISFLILSFTGPQKPSCEFPCFHQAPNVEGKFHHLASSPNNLNNCHSPGPQPNGFHLPLCPSNYLNKQTVSSHRSQGSLHPLPEAEACLRQPLLCKPCTALLDMQCVPPPKCEYTPLKNCC